MRSFREREAKNWKAAPQSEKETPAASSPRPWRTALLKERNWKADEACVATKKTCR